jgi:hypothetical protein
MTPWFLASMLVAALLAAVHRPCLRKGATIAGNAEAGALARRNVRSELAELLRS